MRDALRVLRRRPRPHHPGDRPDHAGRESEIEVTLHEWPLREAMIAHGRRILYISLGDLAGDGGTAVPRGAAAHRAADQPRRRPYDRLPRRSRGREPHHRAGRAARASCAQAETALHDLQVRLTAALRQKERLAGLGGAVAKISHDLRNLLTTAQLLADRIEASPDPGVRRIAPKLVSSLSRAISLCERTLTYGKAEEPPPEPAVFALAPLVAEVLENERQAARRRLRGLRRRRSPAGCGARRRRPALPGAVEPGAQRRPGDRGRRPAGGGDRHGARGGGRTEIRVADTGPGLPQRARENLFQPFRGGVRQGGAGLGLVIAAELVGATAARWRSRRPGRAGRRSASRCRPGGGAEAPAAANGLRGFAAYKSHAQRMHNSYAY